MSSEYYTLEKVSEILGIPTGEVNRLRERSELRAFRDGSSWKFRKAEVDNMLAEKIKSRNKQSNIAGDDSAVTDASGGGLGEDDFDLLSDEVVELSAEDEQNTSAFDAAMEDGFELGEELIDVPTAAKTEPATEKPAAKSTTENANIADDSSIFSLAGENDDIFSLADDDLVLADNQSDNQSGNQSGKLSVAKTSASVAASGTGSKIAEENDLIFATDDLSLAADDDGLTLDESFALAGESDSANVLSLAKSTDKSSEIDSADIGLAEESDEKLFEIEEDNVSAKPAEEQVVFEQLNEDTDFLELINDDSPSEFTDGAIGLTDDFKLTADGIGLDDESESTSQFIPLDEKNALSDGVFGESPFGELPSTNAETSMAGIDFTQQTTQTPNISYQQEVQYSPLIVGSLIAAAVLLIFPCVMLLDLIANIWGWNESIPINSPIMNLITGITK
ncbi:MAG: helix-turn-helix domain-containing protein [Planctomycetaceae bacterium]|jgi:excisionase family DNA binding protein|nr:helix-turn-helix domain-containing protein [Planctomycetaceae bacterium]